MRYLISIICRVIGSVVLIVLTCCAGILLAIVDVLLLRYSWLINGPIPSVIWLMITFALGLVVWNGWIGPASVRLPGSLVEPDNGWRRGRQYFGAIPAGLLAMLCWGLFVVMANHSQMADHPARAFYGGETSEIGWGAGSSDK